METKCKTQGTDLSEVGGADSAPDPLVAHLQQPGQPGRGEAHLGARAAARGSLVTARSRSYLLPQLISKCPPLVLAVGGAVAQLADVDALAGAAVELVLAAAVGLGLALHGGQVAGVAAHLHNMVTVSTSSYHRYLSHLVGEAAVPEAGLGAGALCAAQHGAASLAVLVCLPHHGAGPEAEAELAADHGGGGEAEAVVTHAAPLPPELHLDQVTRHTLPPAPQPQPLQPSSTPGSRPGHPAPTRGQY